MTDVHAGWAIIRYEGYDTYDRDTLRAISIYGGNMNTKGITVYRRRSLVDEWFQTPWHEGMEEFTAHPVALAEARERVVEAARALDAAEAAAMVEPFQWLPLYSALREAVAGLVALEAADDTGAGT